MRHWRSSLFHRGYGWEASYLVCNSLRRVISPHGRFRSVSILVLGTVGFFYLPASPYNWQQALQMGLWVRTEDPGWRSSGMVSSRFELGSKGADNNENCKVYIDVHGNSGSHRDFLHYGLRQPSIRWCKSISCLASKPYRLCLENYDEVIPIFLSCVEPLLIHLAQMAWCDSSVPHYHKMHPGYPKK